MDLGPDKTFKKKKKNVENITLPRTFFAAKRKSEATVLANRMIYSAFNQY